MLKVIRKFAGKVVHPVRTLEGLQLNADMRRLKQQNHVSKSPVATGGPGAVVCLTTFGKRVGEVYLAIESIARGNTLPSRLILWLDDTAILANLPEALIRLQKRGLEILQCKNYGSYKKYYPYVETEPALIYPMVTADDDVIYPPTWLSGLIAANKEFPNCVNAYRARQMILRGGKLAPYREWPLCDSTVPRLRAMATGVSGVIYPPALLKELKRVGTGFETTCPRNDDLWLHVTAIRSNFATRQIQPESIHFPEIPGSQVTSLYSENVAQDDGNDRQIMTTYGPRDLELLERSMVAA